MLIANTKFIENEYKKLREELINRKIDKKTALLKLTVLYSDIVGMVKANESVPNYTLCDENNNLQRNNGGAVFVIEKHQTAIFDTGGIKRNASEHYEFKNKEIENDFARYKTEIETLSLSPIVNTEVKPALQQQEIFNINGYNNNVTINSSMSAIQNKNFDPQELERILTVILQKVPTNITEQVHKEINDCIDVIRTELKNEKPNSTIVNKAVKFIQSIKGSADLAANIIILQEFIEKIFSFLA
jgi:hypothetical protein